MILSQKRTQEVRHRTETHGETTTQQSATHWRTDCLPAALWWLVSSAWSRCQVTIALTTPRYSFTSNRMSVCEAVVNFYGERGSVVWNAIYVNIKRSDFIYIYVFEYSKVKRQHLKETNFLFFYFLCLFAFLFCLNTYIKCTIKQQSNNRITKSW